MKSYKNRHLFNNKPRQSLQGGFTLLEVVIAMGVGAIGIIAFAGLQLKSFEVAEQSRHRSAAAFMANEMFERMSSNSQDYVARQTYQGTMGNNWAAVPDDNGAYNIESFCDEECTPAEMAAGDIEAMKSIARATLPNGNISLTQCGVDNVYDCIIVAWNEDADDIDNCELGTNGSGLNDCFILHTKIW